MRYYIFPTCKETHQLVAEGMDRNLKPIERVGLRIHLSMCRACTGFSKQMRFIQISMRSLGSEEMPKDSSNSKKKD